MMFNHQKAYAILIKQHTKEREQLLKSGISEERINELFAMDIQQLKDDRRYYVHLDDHAGEDDQRFIDKTEPDKLLHWIEQIENPALLEAIRDLSCAEIEIVYLHVIERLPLTIVAAILDRPYGNVQRQYHRSIKKLKNIFI